MNITEATASVIMSIAKAIIIAIMTKDSEAEVEAGLGELSRDGFAVRVLVETGKQRGRLLRSDAQPPGKT